jgi:hypothetical protein
VIDFIADAQIKPLSFAQSRGTVIRSMEACRRQADPGEGRLAGDLGAVHRLPVAVAGALKRLFPSRLIVFCLPVLTHDIPTHEPIIAEIPPDSQVQNVSAFGFNVTASKNL